MILTLNSTNFALDSGFYYSNSFSLEENDTLMSIEVQLNTTGEVSVQQSITGKIWYDIADTSFSCSPNGMESYIECQPKILYRLKSATLFTKALILL